MEGKGNVGRRERKEGGGREAVIYASRLLTVCSFTLHMFSMDKQL